MATGLNEIVWPTHWCFFPFHFSLESSAPILGSVNDNYLYSPLDYESLLVGGTFSYTFVFFL